MININLHIAGYKRLMLFLPIDILPLPELT